MLMHLRTLRITKMNVRITHELSSNLLEFDEIRS